MSANKSHLKKMMEMGIHPLMAEQALSMSGNNLELAFSIVFNSMKDANTNHNKTQENPKNSKGNDICCVCRNPNSDEEKLLDLGCGHKYCSMCLKKHVDDFVVQKRKSYLLVPCVMDRCRQVCGYEMMRNHLSEKGKEFVDYIMKTTLPKNIPKSAPLNFAFDLKEFGYTYNEKEEFRHIETGKKYYYINEKHYIAIGESIVKHIQDKLRHEYELKEYFLDSKKNCNIFRSEHGRKKLMIVIQGSGAVRPGQWARALCMNESLHTGACLDYVNFALRVSGEYDVILLNPNCTKVRKGTYPTDERFDFFDPQKPGPLEDYEVVENSSSGTEHTLFVYDHFIQPLKHVEEYYIVAHSAGGYHTMNLLRERKDSIFKKLKAIGFTDSVHSISFDEDPKVREFVTHHAINWGRSTQPLDTILKKKSFRNCLVLSAGHNKHENTSASCMNSLFSFFEKK